MPCVAVCRIERHLHFNQVPPARESSEHFIYKNVLTLLCSECIIITDDTRASHPQARQTRRPALCRNRGPPRLFAPTHHPSLLGMSEMRPRPGPSSLGPHGGLPRRKDPPSESSPRAGSARY